MKISIERENILQKSKVSLEIEWRNRLETRESEIYRQHEDLMRNLKSAKDEVSFALHVFLLSSIYTHQIFCLFYNHQAKVNAK